jgi:hypothetical protein
MSFGHTRSARELAYQLTVQLPHAEYEVFQNGGHVRAPSGDTYIPDVAVVPVALMSRFSLDPARFEVYEEPLPFVAEAWSPRTGAYDIDTKIPAYRLRGDFELWRLHPFERTLTVWRRQPDGSYEESSHRGGMIRLQALAEVTIIIDALFVAE